MCRASSCKCSTQAMDGLNVIKMTFANRFDTPKNTLKHLRRPFLTKVRGFQNPQSHPIAVIPPSPAPGCPMSP